MALRNRSAACSKPHAKKVGSTIVGVLQRDSCGQAVPATDIPALGATIVALAGGVEAGDVPRRASRWTSIATCPTLRPRAALP
jgi:hypothetical protein